MFVCQAEFCAEADRANCSDLLRVAGILSLGQPDRNMAMLHVAVTGRDRRHLSELRDKFRVVVVGARETCNSIVVDAYIPAERVDWLRKKGYGVQPLEEVETPG